MLKVKKNGLYLFCSLLVLFYIIPQVGLIQKPFHILIGVCLCVLYIATPMSRRLLYTSLAALSILVLIGAIMFFRGTLMTAYIKAVLCFTGIICVPKMLFDRNKEYNILNKLYWLCMIAIIIQFCIFSSHDGRPSLGYEINNSAAYLFLFFLFSDAIGKKSGKIIVIILSFFILSRLLIFSIALFYVIRFFKKRAARIIAHLNLPGTIIGVYILFALFSVWYAQTFQPVVSYDSSIQRISTINDGSNFVRMRANKNSIDFIASKFASADVLLGMGNLEKDSKYINENVVIPHNELLLSILEFGLLAVLIFASFSITVWQKLFGYDNIEYVFSILFYTLILWVHFVIIPSLEVIFIFFLLGFTKQKNILSE